MYPEDLLEAYQVWVECRQDEWQDSSVRRGGEWQEPFVRGRQRLDAAAEAIRVHSYWWTLPDAEAVARAALEMRDLALLPVGGERERLQPYPSAVDANSREQLRARLRDGPFLELAAALDAAGHWSRLPEGERLAAIADVERFGIALGEDMCHERMFFADGEDLAEQGVAALFTEMGPGLLAVGLPLRVSVLSDPFAEDGSWDVDYVLDICGERCEVWTAAQARDMPHHLWYLATIRPLMAIARLLEQAGIPERLFTDAAGGNEGVVYLMRPEVNAIVFPGDGLAPVPAL